MWTGKMNVCVAFVLCMVIGCDCEYDSKRVVEHAKIVEICNGEWCLDAASIEYCQTVLGYTAEYLNMKHYFRLSTNGVAYVHCPNHYVSAKDQFGKDVYMRCMNNYEKIRLAGGIGRWRVIDRRELAVDSSPVEDWSWMVRCDVVVDDVTYSYDFYIRKDTIGLYLGVPVATRSGNVSAFMCFRKLKWSSNLSP